VIEKSPAINTRGFIVGANLPWVGYGTDIGTSAWYPAGGLSSQPASLDLLGGTFAKLAGDGISAVRPLVWTTRCSWTSKRWCR
jgi:hypothetical protein